MNGDALEEKSVKENRSIVTPYAFSICDSLINTPLASPLQRLCALLLDLIIVALLSNVDGVFLALAATYGIYSLSVTPGQRPWVKRLKIGALLFMVGISLSLSYSFISEKFFSESGLVETTYGLGKNASQFDECKKNACRVKVLSNAQSLLENITEDEEKTKTILAEFIDDRELSAKQKNELLAIVFDKNTVKEADQESIADNSSNTNNVQALPIQAEASPEKNESKFDNSVTENKVENPVGIIAWTRAILQDLGIGFGWAAIYFSLLTARWNGQTIGKRLLGIRVVLLDGSSPSLWESFFRYGGYGAGVSTGLLGFLQIFWDPNRQAIQDKISETLVIKTS